VNNLFGINITGEISFLLRKHYMRYAPQIMVPAK